MTFRQIRGSCRFHGGLCLSVLVGCTSCGAGTSSGLGRTHDIEKAPIDGTPVSALVQVGDLARLSAPPIVVHPTFAGAKIVAEYDPELLSLLDRRMDRSELGQSVEVFQFRAQKAGTAEVVLRVSGTAKPVNRIARYRLEIRP